MLSHTVRRVNRLAHLLSAKSYLEIGVHDGQTILNIEMHTRTGVDPSFQFDTKSETNEHTKFFHQYSDDFFYDQPFNSQFDIIFIDGLHTFEQVLRDLTNSISRSHQSSVFLIDDVWPNDIYSAIPDPQIAMRMRAAVGSADQSWHGDVFKIVYFVHDFIPCLNYRTIYENGNPQMLAWFSNKDQRQPKFGNLEKISRLTYLDFIDAHTIMRACPEEEALLLCYNEIKKD